MNQKPEPEQETKDINPLNMELNPDVLNSDIMQLLESDYYMI